MSLGDLDKQWLALLLLLAAEVAGLALMLAAVLKTRLSAGWHRTFCQATYTRSPWTTGVHTLDGYGFDQTTSAPFSVTFSLQMAFWL